MRLCHSKRCAFFLCTPRTCIGQSRSLESKASMHCWGAHTSVSFGTSLLIEAIVYLLLSGFARTKHVSFVKVHAFVKKLDTKNAVLWQAFLIVIEKKELLTCGICNKWWIFGSQIVGIGISTAGRLWTSFLMQCKSILPKIKSSTAAKNNAAHAAPKHNSCVKVCQFSTTTWMLCRTRWGIFRTTVLPWGVYTVTL